MPRKKTEPVTVESKGPTIKYIGKSQILNKESGQYEIRPTPEDRIPTTLINGRKRIDLPSGAEQIAGFQHPDAMFLVNNYRDQFKMVTDKAGEPVSSEEDGSDEPGFITENASDAEQGPAAENATGEPEGDKE